MFENFTRRMIHSLFIDIAFGLFYWRQLTICFSVFFHQRRTSIFLSVAGNLANDWLEYCKSCKHSTSTLLGLADLVVKILATSDPFNVIFCRQNMPQESLKSAVYRSFVTCDDPKGVVECKTMRKSRPSSQKMDHKIESRRSTSKNSDTSSMAYKAEKEEMQQLSKGFKKDVNHSPSSFQLMEVSRGVQKLNGMIDSWTKGVRFDGQSKDIAQDLLKGALDLQESLIMLGKLQEASQFMAELETKKNEKSEMRRIDEVGIERIQSSEFGHKKQRLSADGSSRDHHIEELRKVIRDSFARQNLLPNPLKKWVIFI